MPKSRRRGGKRRNQPISQLDHSPKKEPVDVELEAVQLLQPEWRWSPRVLVAIVAFLAAVVFSYLPTFRWMVNSWMVEPDYSHGFLVLPLAWLILQYRPAFPGIARSPSYWGLSLIGLSLLMRFVAQLVYAEFLDAWSILPLLGGVVWTLFGWQAFLWSLPAVVFLMFMIPLPYQAESLLSWKLQGVATEFSTVILRVFGQPAISEGHTIWIEGQQLGVERACSGLRIFVGVFALAYFWAAVSNRSWLDRLVVFASALPLAIVANAARITLMAILMQQFDGPRANVMIHDYTGLAMIPFAFGLLWLVKTFWEHLYRPMEIMTARATLNAGQ